MQDRLNRIEEKLDRIVDTQSDMRVSLNEHMRRTEIAETNIENISNAIKPIQEHVALITGIAKILPILGSIIGAIIGAWKYLQK